MLYVPYFNKRYIKIKLSEEGEIGTVIPTSRRYIYMCALGRRSEIVKLKLLRFFAHKGIISHFNL